MNARERPDFVRSHLIDRRAFLGALANGLLATSRGAEAQQEGKVYRIGVLWHFSTSRAPRLEAFRQGLKDLGYVEGQNVVIEERSAGGRDELLPAVAAELVRLKVDVIATSGELPIRAARLATSTIPIVMMTSGDPVETGLVASLARPGGNITGLTILSTELSAKRLELLKEAFPKASRVIVLWNPSNAGNEVQLKATLAAVRRFGLTAQPMELQRAGDWESALAGHRQRPDALIVLADTLITNSQNRIIEFAGKNRLPAVYPYKFFVEAGGLMSYGPIVLDLYRRAASYVDKILKGAKPADLPVEQPTKFELVINLKTAKALGLTLPQPLLLRADEVIT